MLYTKIIIQRYSQYPYYIKKGAKNEWIYRVRRIKNNDLVPNNWEVIDIIQLKELYETQKDDIKNFKNSIRSQIKIIDTYWESMYKDFKQARYAMKEIVNQRGFSTFDKDEKDIICKWFLVDPITMLNFFAIEQNLSTQEAINKKITYSAFFNENSVIARQKRYNALYIFIRNLISRENLDMIAYDLKIYEFQDTYINFGREGTMKINYEGVRDVEGIFDYILGTANTNFEENNLRKRVTNPLYGYSVDDIINLCINILDKGFY